MLVIFTVLGMIRCFFCLFHSVFDSIVTVHQNAALGYNSCTIFQCVFAIGSRCFNAISVNNEYVLAFNMHDCTVNQSVCNHFGAGLGRIVARVRSTQRCSSSQNSCSSK